MTTGNHMHNLTTLIKRLEAATSRLEDMAMSLDESSNKTSQANSVSTPSAGPGVPPSIPVPPVTNSHPTPAVAPPVPAPEPAPVQVVDFDAIIKDQVQLFVDLGDKIGGLVAEQSKAVLRAFKAERTFIYVTTKARKPEPFPSDLMTELQKASDTINNLRESNRASPLFNHLTAVTEGIVALGWFFDPKPANFVSEMIGGIEYYGNKVLKEYKDKDNTHVQYIQAYYAIFKSLSAYLKEHYPAGLTWNNNSKLTAIEALKEINSDPKVTSKPTPPSAGPAAPPPPPPPPPPAGALDFSLPATANAGATSTGSDMSAVFAQLNQGDAITSGLRKVDKSEMTHKNPSLRAGSTVPERSNSQNSLSSPTTSTQRGKSPAPGKKPKPESMRAKKPPRKELEGNKWLIENFDSPNEIIEIPAAQNHSILISRCNKTIIKINNKANAISIDNCQGLSLIVDSLVSSLDVIKSSKFALQIDGIVPTVLLDGVDGATLYLPASESGKPPATEIFTSKSTAINVMLPPKPGKEDDDTKECPLPEQIKSYVNERGELVSEIVEHAG